MGCVFLFDQKRFEKLIVDLKFLTYLRAPLFGFFYKFVIIRRCLSYKHTTFDLISTPPTQPVASDTPSP